MQAGKNPVHVLRQNEPGATFEALRKECEEDWNVYIHHPFVQQLADGSLPVESFKHYLIQLYLFTKHYSRAYALAVVKSECLDDLREAAAHVDIQLNYEMALQIDYCAQWGLTETILERCEEHDANRLYTRYFLDQGMTGDLLDLLVALAPCSLGYAEIGARLLDDPNTQLSGNRYREWIELHGGQEFQEGAVTMKRYIDRVASRRGVDLGTTTSERWESLVKNFRTATRLEVNFWEMSFTPPKSGSATHQNWS